MHRKYLDEAKGCRDVALEKDGFTYKDPKETVQNWFTVTPGTCSVLHYMFNRN